MPKTYLTPIRRKEPREYPSGNLSTAEYVAQYYRINGFLYVDQLFHFSKPQE